MSTQPPSLLPYGVVRIDDTELAPDVAALVVLLRVRDSLRLPDQAYVRIADPQLAHADDELLSVGKTLEVLYAAPGSGAATSVFAGSIESIELEFQASGAFIAATAYEPAFALHRARRTQAFQNMTSEEIAHKVIAGAGLTAALGASSAGSIVHPFLLQNEETDWQLLWRLANTIDYEVVGEGRTVHFRPAGSASTGAPLELEVPGKLTSFRPRVSGAQQVESVEVRGWDPANAEAILASQQPPSTDSSPGLQRADIAKASNADTWMIGDRTVLGQDEASALADSVAAKHANAWIDAEGVTRGDPRLRAGCQVRVSGVGSRFGGTYTVTSTTHVLRGGRGYETHFSVSGRSPQTILETLDTSRPAPQWGTTVVVGVVTQTEDPEALGRVRVKHPSLGNDTEGWWARIAGPAAGTNRGLLMMPVAGDEVVLAFEQGDPRRPYVLGAVWNGQALPGELVKQDGSFSLASDHDIDLNAVEQIAIAAQQGIDVNASENLKLEAGKELSLAGGTSVTLEADGSVTVQAGTSLKLEGKSISVEASGVLQISASQVMFQ